MMSGTKSTPMETFIMPKTVRRFLSQRSRKTIDRLELFGRIILEIFMLCSVTSVFTIIFMGPFWAVAFILSSVVLMAISFDVWLAIRDEQFRRGNNET